MMLWLFFLDWEKDKVALKRKGRGHHMGKNDIYKAIHESIQINAVGSHTTSLYPVP